MGLGNAATPQSPNRFPGGPSQNSFGLGNSGIPQSPNRFFGPPSQNPINPGNIGTGNTGIPQANRMEQYLQTADRFLSTAQQQSSVKWRYLEEMVINTFIRQNERVQMS